MCVCAKLCKSVGVVWVCLVLYVIIFTITTIIDIILVIIVLLILQFHYHVFLLYPITKLHFGTIESMCRERNIYLKKIRKNTLYNPITPSNWAVIPTGPAMSQNPTENSPTSTDSNRSQ